MALTTPARAEHAFDVANDARPDPPSVRTEPRDRSPEVGGPRWYGWQTLAFDAASVGTMAAGLESSSEVLVAGLLGYAFGGPIVHAAHGHGEKALGSFGLRLAGPFVGGALGTAARECTRDPQGDRDYDRCGPEAFYGVLIGAAVAMLVDATLLANEDVAVGAPKRTSARASFVRPDVTVTRDRAMFSLGGTF